MLGSIHKGKRRRAIRYAIEIEAVLLPEKSQSIPCIILDFCNSGFFVGFKDSAPKIPLQKWIAIRFSMGSEPVGQHAFEIEAKVVHIMATGLGVEIENMPLSALKALTKAVDIGPRNILPKHHRLSKNELKQLNFKNTFKKMLVDKLAVLIGGFYESVGDYLGKAEEYASYFANNSAFDDFITTLKLSQETLVSEFCILVVSQIDYISEFSQKRNDVFTIEIPLSMIEKEDFEDWLSISDVIRKLNYDFENHINQVVRELCRVFGFTRSTVINPVSPAVLCESFRETILPLNFDKKVNRLLYRSFSQALINNLSDLYQQVADILSKQESAANKVRYIAHQPQPHSFADEGGYLLNQPVVTNQGFSKQTYQQIILSSDNQSLDQFKNAKPISHRPVSKVAEKLLDILNEVDEGTLENFQKSLSKYKEDTDQVQADFSSDEVITAISQVQNAVEKDSNTRLDSMAIQKSLSDILESIGKGSKYLSRRDARHLEIYGQFFETLFDDYGFSEEFKGYLNKIQLPLLSLPFKGDDFLQSDSHPARNILNQLAVLEPAVKNNKIIKNINVKSALDRLVYRITQESNTNPDVFTEVEQELDNIAKLITKSIDSNINRIVQAYEGQQKLEIARRAVQNEIDQRIANKPIPTVLPLLMESGWQHLLVIAELNKEKNKEEYHKYFKVLDDLLFWFDEQESVLKVQAGTIANTIEFIKENLISVCTNVTERRIIIEELTALLLGEGVAKARQAVKTVKIPAINPEEHIQNHVPDQNWAQVEQLQVGEWLIMLMGSQGSVPMKLIWIGDVLQVYVIVNRDGLTKVELNKTELAEYFRTGAVIKIESMDEPLVDRATSLMLQKMHEKLVLNATHDPETELITKDEFVRQVKNELSKPSDAGRTLCHLEVLDFRVITTICGLTGGSQLMQRMAQMIKEALTNDDIIARIGDKTFAILFKHCNTDQGYEKSKKLIKLICNKHFEWQEKSFPISVSVGLVPIGDNSYDIHQLLQHADVASISAERSGPNSILIFTNDDETLKHQNKLYEWIGHIDNVIHQNRLFLRCQMILSIEQSKNKHLHYEILLGIRGEEGNIIPPDHFIPAVERSKRMPEIDQWVIKNVFSWIQQNTDDFEKIDGFSINLSGQSINNEEFLEFLKGFLAVSNAPLTKITFEITETVAAESLVFTKKFIQTIKQFGCKFSLDDFGSGYSSYSYLKNLDVDYLKIDGAFVKDIVNNKADLAIVKSMNEIAHSLGLETIAEYVENTEILDILKLIGVDYAQGYGIQKPIPLKELVIEAPAAELFYFEDDTFWDI